MEAAYHGTLGAITKAVEPLTEADPPAVLLHLAVLFGNVIGRTAHFWISSTRHYCKLYLAVIGKTSTGRKGTAKDIACFAFDQIDNEQARALCGEPPQALADTVHAAWVAFVTSGDPNNKRLPDWPRWDPNRRPTLRFDLKSQLIHNPAPEERALWDGVL